MNLEPELTSPVLADKRHQFQSTQLCRPYQTRSFSHTKTGDHEYLELPRDLRFPMAVHHNKDLTCSVRVVDIGAERGLLFTFACLLSLCHLGLFSLYAITAKGWHAPSGSRTQQVHPSLGVHVHGHGLQGFTAYFTAPPGVNLSTAQVNIRVDSCHSPTFRL